MPAALQLTSSSFVCCSAKVLKPDVPIALRAQAVLLYGLTILHTKKTTIYLKECDELKNKIAGMDVATANDETVSKNKQSTRCGLRPRPSASRKTDPPTDRACF